MANNTSIRRETSAPNYGSVDTNGDVPASPLQSRTPLRLLARPYVYLVAAFGVISLVSLVSNFSELGGWSGDGKNQQMFAARINRCQFYESIPPTTQCRRRGFRSTKILMGALPDHFDSLRSRGSIPILTPTSHATLPSYSQNYPSFQALSPPTQTRTRSSPHPPYPPSRNIPPR